MGSHMIAQVFESTAFLRASRSSKGTYLNPGIRGEYPLWYFSCAVAVNVARVLPWKERSMVMTSYRSPPIFSLENLRASFNAPSFASAPLLQKNTLSAKECWQRREANWIWGSI